MRLKGPQSGLHLGSLGAFNLKIKNSLENGFDESVLQHFALNNDGLGSGI